MTLHRTTLSLLIASLTLALAVPAGAASLRVVDAALELDGHPHWVSFSVDDATGIEGFELTITYDPAIVRIVGPVRRTAATEGCLLADNSLEPGTLRIALACLSPLQGAGNLLYVPVQAAAPGASPFAITYSRINEQPAGGHPIGLVMVREPAPAHAFLSVAASVR